jgi:hypothetical protein
MQSICKTITAASPKQSNGTTPAPLLYVCAIMLYVENKNYVQRR